jgi:lipopolysaccharide transport system ATP-binding protein
MESIIQVDNVTKFYRLGQISSGTIKDDLSRWWSKVLGEEDPLLKIGQTGDAENNTHWALKGVSFDVKQGEVLGIIGKNGAGKSTLLKILSRVTAPTGGHIKIHGRIASLLEVGTGFHPDLTGRENVYQNGAILGMKRSEIKSKFDEIVDFSGVAKFIDTPVKRYSSGMYVRLAFAVAAHLEPEILIVDEVLAVGDADFQKKCLGKMKAVSAGEGRTVLFVSHNMQAIKNLCNKSIYLVDGKIQSLGETEKVIICCAKRKK